MRVLFGNGTPRGIAPALAGHEVAESRQLGWDKLRNGELLQAAEQAGFDVLLTPDQNMEYQQNLEGRKMAIVVLGKGRWTLIEPHLEQIAAAVNAATPGSCKTVDIPYRAPKQTRRPEPGQEHNRQRDEE